MQNERFEEVEDLINSDLFCDWVYHQKQADFWQNWQIDNPQRQAMVREAKAFLQQLAFQKSSINKHEVTADLEMTWAKIEATLPKNTPTKVTRRKLFTFWRAAAAVLLLAAASWSINSYFSTQNIVYTTNFGETKKIRLPDDSQVVLQANSELKVSKNWSKEAVRKVWLSGEAFFDVTKKQTSTPVKFVVATADFSVEVLGTQFDVLHRAKNKRVVLQEGKVKFKWGNKQELELIPNEMVAFSKTSNTFQKTKISATPFTAWAQQKLILNNTPLEEIARILEENYGYEVTFSPKVNQTQTRSSLGEITIKNLADFITVIEASYEVELNIKDNLININ